MPKPLDSQQLWQAHPDGEYAQAVAIVPTLEGLPVALTAAQITAIRAAPSSAGAAIAVTAQVANSWFGWQLPVGYRFRPTGVLILTRGDNNGQYPRDFTVQVANGSTLTSGTAVNAWTAAQVFTNQTQIGGPSLYSFVSISTAQSGRQFAFEQQQNSTSDLWLVAQEFCWFGELFLP